MPNAGLTTLDTAILALYFLGLLGVIWWVTRRKKEGSAGFFLAGRDVGWVAIGASLFASNIGSEHLVGLTGTGAASGLAVGHFEWLAALILLLLAWLFVPFYLRSGVYTMPEFLERRFNAASRWYFTLITVVGYVLTKISVALYAGGLILEEVAGVPFWLGAIAIILITGIYTVVGGLGAVIYTDLVQAFVLIAGSALLVWLGMAEVGGWTALQAQAPEGFFDVWKSVAHPEFPWTGIVFGAPILGLWYWCTDQYIVQRTLSARNESQANTGTLFAAYLKLLPPFLFVLPGIIAAVLYADITAENSDTALPVLVQRLLPAGVRGLFVAALLAALMSSLSSIFNSSATLLTFDIFRQLRPSADEQRLVLVGRIMTGLLVVAGLAWIPLIPYVSSQLYIYLQSVQGYIAPPIAACFLFGLFFARLNGTGALSCLLSGFVMGAARLVLELANGPERTGLPTDTLWEWIAEINFLHFAALLFLVCTVILFGASLTSARPESHKLRGLIWSRKEESPFAEPERELPEPGLSVRRRRINGFLSFVLVLLLTGLWLYFS